MQEVWHTLPTQEERGLQQHHIIIGSQQDYSFQSIIHEKYDKKSGKNLPILSA